jgi:AhpD family alkylhydroperoxidase
MTASRLNVYDIAPEGTKALRAVEAYLHHTTLGEGLIELVKMRASQINGCAYCLDMHSKDARAAGETEQRLYLLNAWREAPFYTERERAALEWTEAVTRLTDGEVSDEVYANVSTKFTKEEIVTLTLAVAAINSWNRLNIAFRMEAGGYKAGMLEQAMKTA